ncbi:hypothetical protein F4861DRAFT_331097 [Xylaria intraflava]|nr:hypothetical protein F4861DRAFT_331097 [Xylaria intraflava]
MYNPGGLIGPMQWLVPRYPEVPGSIMKLGSILKDPRKLESSLNLHTIPEIDPKAIRDASQAVQTSLGSEMHKKNGLQAKASTNIPILGAGASTGLDMKHRRNVATTVNALNARAVVFMPSDDFMAAALADTKVQKFARDCLFSKPLYVVVGVATASKLWVSESRSEGHEVTANPNVSLPIDTTGLISAGADVGFEHARGSLHRSESEIDEECDFAYRVREFFYSKLRRRVKEGDDYTESALFDSERSYGGDDEFFEEPKFEWLEPEDFTDEDLITLSIEDVGGEP